jgi:hypothetical protein
VEFEFYGIMAAYCDATSYVTDLEPLVPLIQYIIDQNKKILNGSAAARALCMLHGVVSGLTCLTTSSPLIFSFWPTAYYESSLDDLLDTVLAITCHGMAPTVILACYEERTKEICGLVSRWHTMLEPLLLMDDIPAEVLDAKFKQDFVRLVKMSPIKRAQNNVHSKVFQV